MFVVLLVCYRSLAALIRVAKFWLPHGWPSGFTGTAVLLLTPYLANQPISARPIDAVPLHNTCCTHLLD